ncbi:hypothetical protein [Paracidovorax citrulli]|uniref:hypothetical protein n=1 Tax=Paracidovorax citrulli TaxID=80869 RepID=UPI00110F8205|nr:hypothetical protein [Paracidovorax citrulli]
MQKVGGNIWQKSTHDIDTLITLEEADAKFAREAAGGNEEVLSGNQRSTFASVGIYASKQAIFEIGVAKRANFGGSNLTEEQRRTMRYEVTMSFRLRNDVDPKAVKR